MVSGLRGALALSTVGHIAAVACILYASSAATTQPPDVAQGTAVFVSWATIEAPLKEAEVTKAEVETSSTVPVSDSGTIRTSAPSQRKMEQVKKVRPPSTQKRETSENTPSPIPSVETHVEGAQVGTGVPGIAQASPDYLRNPAPVYPESARRLRREGIVTLSVSVDTSGLPTSVTVSRSSGYDSLDTAAQSAVSAWKFKPGSVNGAPVTSRVEVPIRFSLATAEKQ